MQVGPWKLPVAGVERSLKKIGNMERATPVMGTLKELISLLIHGENRMSIGNVATVTSAHQTSLTPAFKSLVPGQIFLGSSISQAGTWQAESKTWPAHLWKGQSQKF